MLLVVNVCWVQISYLGDCEQDEPLKVSALSPSSRSLLSPGSIDNSSSPKPEGGSHISIELMNDDGSDVETVNGGYGLNSLLETTNTPCDDLLVSGMKENDSFLFISNDGGNDEETGGDKDDKDGEITIDLVCSNFPSRDTGKAALTKQSRNVKVEIVEVRGKGGEADGSYPQGKELDGGEVDQSWSSGEQPAGGLGEVDQSCPKGDLLVPNEGLVERSSSHGELQRVGEGGEEEGNSCNIPVIMTPRFLLKTFFYVSLNHSFKVKVVNNFRFFIKFTLKMK